MTKTSYSLNTVFFNIQKTSLFKKILSSEKFRCPRRYVIRAIFLRISLSENFPHQKDLFSYATLYYR